MKNRTIHSFSFFSLSTKNASLASIANGPWIQQLSMMVPTMKYFAKLVMAKISGPKDTDLGDQVYLPLWLVNQDNMPKTGCRKYLDYFTMFENYSKCLIFNFGIFRQFMYY